MNEEIKGQFVTKTAADGTKYAMYVPENVNENTPVFTYVHGSGGPNGNWTTVRNAVAENGSDAMIIMPTMSWNSNWGEKTMNIVNYEKTQYGITNTNVSSGGFSMGGFSGYVTVAENIKQNPDADPQIAYFIDDYSSLTYEGYRSAVADEETMNLFRENGTVFFVLESASKNDAATNAYASSGVNVIRVLCANGDHSAINKDFFSNGMYDYVAGGALPAENYRYQKYNSATGQWEDIPYEEISTIDALYDYYGLDSSKANLDKLYSLADITIKSEDKTLQTHINNIRGAIRNAKFLTTNYSSASFLSTTQIPQRIPEVITDYFTTTASLLNSIARKTVAIAKIAGEISYLDNQMASRTVLLNQSTPLYTTAETLPELSLGTTDIIDDTQTTTLASSPATTAQGTLQQLGTDVVSSPSTQQYSTTNSNYTSSLPNYSNLSNSYGTSSNGTSASSTQYPTVQYQTSTPQYQTSSQSSTPQYSSSQTTSSPTISSTNSTPEAVTTPEEIPVEEYFPKYDELYSTDDQIVYNYNDEYKVVVHYEDDKVTAVEHYYDFNTTEEATQALEQLQTQYAEVENFDRIIQNDRYVKVLFKEEMYNEKTLDQLKQQYEELEQVLENQTELEENEVI